MRFPLSFYHCLSRPSLLPLLLFLCGHLPAASITDHPFPGITAITRQETSPRNFTAHIIQIDVTTPGLRFKLTRPGGPRETVRQTTLEFLQQEHAQLAINAHFFAPYPSAEMSSDLIGLAASDGTIYSDFEAPAQAYALVTNAPAINIDRQNHLSVIHASVSRTDLWTTLAGSAQIVTDGKVTLPVYRDAQHPEGELTEGGPSRFSNNDSWYARPNARTAIAIADNGRTLLLFTVDSAAGSQGLTVIEMAQILVNDYHATEALNLDGGGSTTLAMEDPVTHIRKIANVSADTPLGRAVASNLAIFAAPATTPATSK